MAKHIYDKEGNYKGKILSDEEHSEKERKDFLDKCFFCNGGHPITFYRGKDICSTCNKKPKKFKDKIIASNRSLWVRSLILIAIGIAIEKTFNIPPGSNWYYIVFGLLWIFTCFLPSNVMGNKDIE